MYKEKSKRFHEVKMLSLPNLVYESDILLF